MPKKVQKRSACSPSVWKKFSLLEKLVWNDLYSSFLATPEIFAAGWTDKADKKKREITAHNMACQGVWALRDGLISAFKSK